MWGSVEMADIRCAFTYQAAQHCRDQQAEVTPSRHARLSADAAAAAAAASASVGRKVGEIYFFAKNFNFLKLFEKNEIFLKCFEKMANFLKLFENVKFSRNCAKSCLGGTRD